MLNNKSIIKKKIDLRTLKNGSEMVYIYYLKKSCCADLNCDLFISAFDLECFYGDIQ